MSALTSITVNLTDLSDDQLLSQTKSLVHKEKQTTLEILQYLREVERRRLYAQRGFSSLYAYCTEELKYSESQAYRRISSMRLIRDIPEVEEKIATGKLTLATASQAQSFFSKEAKEKGVERKIEQKKEVLLTLEGQSKRETEKSLLELCPQLVKLQERTKTLTPEYTQISIVLTTEQEALLIRLRELKPDKQSTAELFEWLMQRTLKQIDPLRKAKPSKTTLSESSPMPKNLTSPNQTNVIQESPDSHQSISSNLLACESQTTLTDKTAPSCRDTIDKTTSSNQASSTQIMISKKTRFQVQNIETKLEGRDTFSSKGESAPISTEEYPRDEDHLPRDSKNSRYIPSSFRQEIWFRAEGCCEYQDHISGNKCGARKGLQIDHVQPLALGGKTALDNLRLLCPSHNQWAAIQALGVDKMKVYLK